MQDEAQMNPLDDMTWEQRFQAAFEALCAAEMRAEDAERELARLRPKK